MWKRGILRVRHNKRWISDQVPLRWEDLLLFGWLRIEHECYLYNYHDPASVHPANSTCQLDPPYQNTLMECAMHVSYIDGLGYVGDNNGVNFYDEGLAHMALIFARGGSQR